MNFIRDSREIGIYALVLATIKGYTPEAALEYIETGKLTQRKDQQRYNSRNDVIDMIVMRVKEDMTYADIAEIYSLRAGDNIWRKIKRLTDKRNSHDMYLLREAGLYYYEIAELYGISKQAIHNRIQRYTDKKNKEVTQN